MQDILLDGDHHYWQRRAQQFEDARRKSGEYIGSEETPESMAARDRALTETAQACRNKAEAVRMYGDPELTGVLSMVLTDQLLTEGRRAA
ncbi:MAG: hypothetical protein LKI24_14185 [Acidipropionibacterium sp.]|jgi:hypothetical protein|nr:hypothetical protein [Acidipropionibacterium sp.]